ncbi:MAG TPA: hypothetical protein VFR18_02450 [Terriglobia bacterium]|nr:hypothetical protein [Terriglobia bacterium]
MDSLAENRGYRAAAKVALLAAIVALTVAITLAVERGRTPAFMAVGKAVVDTPTSLHREPSDSTATTGTLQTGVPVELLQYLPPNAMDSWVLIRSSQNPEQFGYSRLRNLDQIETENNQLDVWHAAHRLEKTGTDDLRKRLAAISEKLKTPLETSATADEIYRIVATETVRLADESLDPDEARALLASAEGYLNRISAEWQVATEITDVRSEIQKVQIALGDIPDPAAPAPPVQQTSARAELSRLLKEANAAFQSGRYAKAAELSQQVLAKGQGKRELAPVVEQARALQRKSEAAQEEFEKVNIQNQ